MKKAFITTTVHPEKVAFDNDGYVIACCVGFLVMELNNSYIAWYRHPNGSYSEVPHNIMKPLQQFLMECHLLPEELYMPNES